MKKILAITALIVLSGVGCIQIQTGGAGGDGGVYKSADFGDTWIQKVFVRQEKNRNITINNVNVVNLVVDPTNPQTIYLGTRENGMFATNDEGESWRPILTDKGEVRAMAVDPKNKEILFAAIKEKLVKSTDNGKTWKLIYNEPRFQAITEIQVDTFDSKRVYAGINSGELIKSQDGGQSWSLVRGFDSKIQKILINPKDSRTLYVATANNGIFKSEDTAGSWRDLKAGYQKFEGSLNFQDLTLNRNQPNLLIYASDFGLLRSTDSGINWQEIKLLTPPKTVTILSVVQNFRNPNEIVYGTSSNLFKTRDNGLTWVSKPLPTNRAANRLAVDPDNPNIIYLGALKIKR